MKMFSSMITHKGIEQPKKNAFCLKVTFEVSAKYNK